MSDETNRLKKIATAIRKSTCLKDEKKILKVSKALDEFANFILQSYLEEIREVKK